MVVLLLRRPLSQLRYGWDVAVSLDAGVVVAACC